MPSDLSPLWISLRVAAIATLFTIFLGLAVARWMWGYRGSWKPLIESFLLAPLVLPPTVVGFLLLMVLGKTGAIGQLLPPNLNLVFTESAAILTGMVVAFPLMYKTTLGAFEQIDPTLLQAARTLGATEPRIFGQIILPLALPGILAGTTLGFARALGEFGATLMLAGNIPGQTQTIPMAIYFAVEAGETQTAWFWSLTILGLSLLGLMVVHYAPIKKRSKDRWQSPTPTDHEIIASTLPLTSPILSETSEPPHLAVEIEKQLLDFKLKVTFATESQPLGVLGASGAGKSLLLRCIAGIETPDSGQIVLKGRILFDAQQQINIPSRDRRVALLFQNYALFPHLTVAQNIAFGLPKGGSPAMRQSQIALYLSALHLEGLAHRFPHQLSGGQQQRVALARAFASQPEALLLDEPLSALDTHLRHNLEAQMMQCLRVYSGVTLWVTHHLDEAYRTCNTLLILEQGQAIALAPKQTLFEHPPTLSIARLTGCQNLSRAQRKGAQQIAAINWGCTLNVSCSIPENLTQVGIRAHHIGLMGNTLGEDGRSPLPHSNLVHGWPSSTRDSPYHVTVYLKLHSIPTHSQDYHLEVEILKDRWMQLQDLPLPWSVSLDPQHLILIADTTQPKSS